MTAINKEIHTAPYEMNYKLNFLKSPRYETIVNYSEKDLVDR